MTAGRGSDVQRAIAFLASPELGTLQPDELPPRPDYEALARHARDLGHDLSPGAIQKAFGLVMLARRLASLKPSLSDGEDRSTPSLLNSS